MKMKANETRNELKVSDKKKLLVEDQRTHEEQTKNDEERRKIFMKLLTETSWKRYRGTSTGIFFTETRFFTQNSLNA